MYLTLAFGIRDMYRFKNQYELVSQCEVINEPKDYISLAHSTGSNMWETKGVAKCKVQC